MYNTPTAKPHLPFLPIHPSLTLFSLFVCISVHVLYFGTPSRGNCLVAGSYMKNASWDCMLFPRRRLLVPLSLHTNRLGVALLSWVPAKYGLLPDHSCAQYSIVHTHELRPS